MDTITLTNRHGIHVTLNPLGACWTSCVLPLSGGPREILLGSSDLATMLAGSSYLGASVGRYAGRIANARFAGHALATNQCPTRPPPATSPVPPISTSMVATVTTA